MHRLVYTLIGFTLLYLLLGVVVARLLYSQIIKPAGSRTGTGSPPSSRPRRR
ncbi:MAG: hypothetical protein U0133_06315 [Gemmatimonadales bacterium]